MRLVISLLLTLSFVTGCATDRVLTQPSQSDVAKKVQVGDQIQVITQDQKFWEIKVTSRDNNSISGTQDGKPVSIAIKNIKEIRYRSVSAGKTLGATVLGSLALLGLGIVAVLVSY